MDNETNTIIKVSCFVGLMIEIWKINKVVDVSINAENPTILGIFPRLQIKDKGSYEESGTKVFDKMVRFFECNINIWDLTPLKSPSSNPSPTPAQSFEI
jgi:hypothetical protein